MVRLMGGESATAMSKLWFTLYRPAICVAMTFLPVWAAGGPTFMGVPHCQSPMSIQLFAQGSKPSRRGSAQPATALPEQVPAIHVSISVQELWSLHKLPLGPAEARHMPFASHAPTEHWG